MGAIMTLLGLVDPITKVVKAIAGARQEAADAETEQQRIEAEERVDALKVQRDLLLKRSDERQSQMGFRIWWVVWFPPAMSWGLWLSFGILDSINWGFWPFASHDLAYALPPQLKEYADAISISLFGSGAAVGAVQAITNAIVRRARQ